MAKKIKAPKHPHGAEIAYRNYLQQYLQEVIKYSKNGNNRGIENATRAAIKYAESIGGKISAHVLREIKKNLKDGLIKSDAQVWTERAVAANDAPYLDAFVFRNTLFIQNVTNEVRIKIYDEIRKNATDLEPLEKRIKEVTGFSDFRVKLIARDQTAKLNSELSALRHKAAGFTRYEWATSGDERVRDEHKHLNGNVYQYDAPTDEKDGLPPGQPIQCRCVAEPIFEELL